MYDEIVGDLARNSPIAVVGWKLHISINGGVNEEVETQEVRLWRRKYGSWKGDVVLKWLKLMEGSQKVC